MLFINEISCIGMNFLILNLKQNENQISENTHIQTQNTSSVCGTI